MKNLKSDNNFDTSVMPNEDKLNNSFDSLFNTKIGSLASEIANETSKKMNFNENDLLENLKSFFTSISKSKPEAVKGSFIKKITIASTMGVGLEVNLNSLR